MASRFLQLSSAKPEAPAPNPFKPTWAERMGRTSRVIPNALFSEKKRLGMAAVGDSDDLQRILNLPWRPQPDATHLAFLVREMTAQLRRVRTDPCACGGKCITELKDVQAWYLAEAQKGGALGHIVVGGGKTGIDILLPMVVPGVKNAVLLIPSSLRAQFAKDFSVWSQHFRTPNLAGSGGLFYPDRPVLRVVTYSELSNARFATWLAANAPDMIIADEGQNLKARSSVRTNRFLRYFAEHESTRFFVHSGTLTTRSLDDYAHLSALALRDGSPLPLEPSTVREWCSAVDPSPNGNLAPPGALLRLCNPGEHVREGLRRRLLGTRGVVATEDARLPIELHVRERPVTVPDNIKEALASIRRTKTRPDGEEFVEEMEVARCARQMASGFFYRWKYPRGEPEELILKWFSRRCSWHRALREKLEYRSDHLDSPLLCRQAAVRFLQNYSGPLPVWNAPEWSLWEEVADKVSPEKDTVWSSDFLVKDAVQWATERPGIVFYLHTAFGHAVSKAGGFPLYGEGAEASEQILSEKGDRSIVASIRAHGTGKNLQAFCRMLVSNPPSDGGAWEQLIGRTHRHGQLSPLVTVDVYRHTEEFKKALKDARDYAKYIQQTTGHVQKLRSAEFFLDSDDYRE